MILLLKSLALVTGFAFIAYGISCLLTQKMIDEFARFGHSKWRRTTGYLQLLGGLAIITGIFLALYYWS